MRMVDLIVKKQNGKELTTEEIQFFVKGYTDGSIPDYQASALAMAIYFQDMTDQERADLTMAFFCCQFFSILFFYNKIYHSHDLSPVLHLCSVNQSDDRRCQEADERCAVQQLQPEPRDDVRRSSD